MRLSRPLIVAIVLTTAIVASIAWGLSQRGRPAVSHSPWIVGQWAKPGMLYDLRPNGTGTLTVGRLQKTPLTWRDDRETVYVREEYSTNMAIEDEFAVSGDQKILKLTTVATTFKNMPWVRQTETINRDFYRPQDSRSHSRSKLLPFPAGKLKR